MSAADWNETRETWVRDRSLGVARNRFAGSRRAKKGRLNGRPFCPSWPPLPILGDLGLFDSQIIGGKNIAKVIIRPWLDPKPLAQTVDLRIGSNQLPLEVRDLQILSVEVILWFHEC
jgi:hypothetical protein